MDPYRLEGTPERKRSLAWKCTKCASISICRQRINTNSTEVLFFFFFFFLGGGPSNLNYLWRRHVCSLMADEEQKKSSARRANAHFRKLCPRCSWRHIVQKRPDTKWQHSRRADAHFRDLCPRCSWRHIVQKRPDTKWQHSRRADAHFREWCPRCSWRHIVQKRPDTKWQHSRRANAHFREWCPRCSWRHIVQKRPDTQWQHWRLCFRDFQASIFNRQCHELTEKLLWVDCRIPHLWCSFLRPKWHTAYAEIQDPAIENPELKGSSFRAWSRSEYSHTCFTYCEGFLFWTNFYSSDPFTCIFPKPLPSFSCVSLSTPVLVWARRIK